MQMVVMVNIHVTSKENFWPFKSPFQPVITHWLADILSPDLINYFFSSVFFLFVFFIHKAKSRTVG